MPAPFFRLKGIRNSFLYLFSIFGVHPAQDICHGFAEGVKAEPILYCLRISSGVGGYIYFKSAQGCNINSSLQISFLVFQLFLRRYLLGNIRGGVQKVGNIACCI